MLRRRGGLGGHGRLALGPRRRCEGAPASRTAAQDAARTDDEDEDDEDGDDREDGEERSALGETRHAHAVRIGIAVTEGGSASASVGASEARSSRAATARRSRRRSDTTLVTASGPIVMP